MSYSDDLKAKGKANRAKLGAEHYVPMQSLLDDHSIGRTGWDSEAGGNVPTREESMVLEGVDRSALCPECFTAHKGECW